MLFNPAVIMSAPLALLGTVLIIVGIKSVAAYYIVRAFGHDHDKGLTIAASLAQIGEFSFILITMGVKLAIVPTEARDLVVAGAMLSILVNPLLFHLLDRRTIRRATVAAPEPAEAGPDATEIDRPESPEPAR
jgi:CPA2 family monovalent cation:H+ antiporter-2